LKVLALERNLPNVKPADIRPHLQEEAWRVWELYLSGVLREIYFRQGKSSAVLILECASLAEAQAVLNTLPLVQAGLIEFEVIPLSPYPGFARLFKDV
jgi:muconolactone delta-isomerase